MPDHQYDVFLCHASADKPMVEKIAEKLRRESLNPFLDIWNLIPGEQIQPGLETALQDSACCAVFIGAGDRGPWQNNEIQAVLQRQTRDKKFRVIPVFLSGAPDADELNNQHQFLMLNLGVDFRGGPDDPDALRRLIAGIEGRSPGNAPTRRRRSGEPGKLTIELSLSRDQLTRRYLGPYGSLVPDRRHAWSTFESRFGSWYSIGAGAIKTKGLDQAIFDLLFWEPGGYFHREVLAEVFPSDQVAPNPNHHPVRIRLHLNDSRLTNLPWSCLTWEDMDLAKLNWTLELAAQGQRDSTWPKENEHLRTPCTVLIIAPEQNRLGSDSHTKTMVHKFKDLWLAAEIRVATTQADIEAAISDRSPRIVYFHGSTHQTNDTVDLLLDDGKLPLTTLAKLWQHSPPQILFLNLVEEDRLNPNWVVRPTAEHIPLVVVQHWPFDEIQKTRDLALDWFRELLTNDEPYVEPVNLLHRYSVCTTVAYSGYDNWRTDTVGRTHPSVRKPLAKLLLNRDDQRAYAMKARSELLTELDRRMTCLLCYGGPGNLAKMFADQILAYLEQQTIAERVPHPRLTLELPSSDDFSQRDLDRVMRKQLGIGSQDSMERALDQHRPTVPGNPSMALLIDWQVRDLEGIGITDLALEAWLDFCQDQLTEYCPPGLKLLGFLTLEAPLERRAALDELLDDLVNRYDLLEKLNPLHDVERSHLTKFLASNDCRCPKDKDLQDIMPDLILKETKGRFEDTANLIDEGERDWWRLRDRLVNKYGLPTPHSPNPKPRGSRRL